MAEALLKTLHGERFDVLSAGTEPTGVSPFAVKVLSEIGIDICDRRSKNLSEFSNQKFDYVITVCDGARESCPVFPGGGKGIHKSFADPSALTGSDEERMEGFRRIRDQIRDWIETDLFKEIGAAE
jgi:arsenate reductase